MRSEEQIGKVIIIQLRTDSDTIFCHLLSIKNKRHSLRNTAYKARLYRM